MKFKVKQEELLNVLSAAIKIVPDKPIIDALANFLFRLKGDKLKISASDSESTLCFVIPAENNDNSEGCFLVGAKVLYESIRQIPQCNIEITLEEEKKRLIVNWGTGKSCIPVFDADTFPTQQKMTPRTCFEVNAKTLGEALSQTVFATADDNLRPALSGVLFHLKADSTVLAASNSHILSTAELKGVKATSEGQFVIHRRPLMALIPLLGRANAASTDVQVQFDSNNARLLIGNCLMTVRLVDCKYPSYTSIFPSEDAIHNEIAVSRDELLGIIRRIGVFKTKDAGSLKLKMEKGRVILSTTGESKAKAHEQMNCTCTGDEFSIIFNIDALDSLVSKMPYEKIRLLIQDAKRAVVLAEDQTEGKSEGGQTKMLIMPSAA